MASPTPKSPSRRGLLDNAEQPESRPNSANEKKYRVEDEEAENGEKTNGDHVPPESKMKSPNVGRLLIDGELGVELTALGTSGTPVQMKPSMGMLFSPLSFKKFAEARDEISCQTPNTETGGRHGVNLPGVGRVSWETVKSFATNWLRNPKNLAILVWGLGVGVSGALLFMVMVGMLNAVIPKKSVRNIWYEVNNQILNALFTLMCLYLHPQRFLHLYQLYRWKTQDILALRKVYCKGGTRKPHEWFHMLVVVFLLHMNCFSQYALCGLNWGYRRSERPAIGVGITLAAALGCAVGAGMYNSLSPLGKDYVEPEMTALTEMKPGDLEKGEMMISMRRSTRMSERRHSFALRDGKLVAKPEWQGGLFDCCMEPEVAVVSTFCGLCVFGWNMDRLGFGNRFVHITTFALVCTAPFWIFLLAAVNIDNKYVQESLIISGLALCVFGLMYGGFWRIRMRKTYGLPAQRWCCGQPNMTDCTQWLFCSLCSLCQEVRTSEYYDIHDDKFYLRKSSEDQSFRGPSPLSQESRASEPIAKHVDLASTEVVPPSEIGEQVMVAPTQVPYNKDSLV